MLLVLMLGSLSPGDIIALQDRLRESAVLFSRIGLAGQPCAGEAVSCSCEGYCSGSCFAPGCAGCPAATWSFPGGESMCLDPGPLGSGLLCTLNAQGTATQDACCSVGGKHCALPTGSCCASGDCSACPPPQTKRLFPPLNASRFWNGTTSTCHEH